MPGSHSTAARARPPASTRWLCAAAWLCPGVGLLAAGWVLENGCRDAARMEQSIAAHNQLKLASLVDALTSHLTHVGITLRTIAAAPGVRQMREDAREFVAEIFEQNYSAHRLAEVYVIQRDFDGSGRPFMTFEHEIDGEPLGETHSPDREAAEYAVQIDHVRRFASDPSAEEAVSAPISLCIGEPGLVFSTPVRDGAQLRGAVAGMIRSEALTHLIDPGDNMESALLLDADNKVLARLRASDDLLQAVMSEWPPSHTDPQPPRRIAGKTLLSAPAAISAHTTWRIAILYDPAAHLASLGVSRTTPGVGIAATVALLGLIAGVLFRTTRDLLLARHEALSRADELSHVTRVTTISELASGLAHEINQPLTAIVTYVEACRLRAATAPLPGDTREDLDAIAEESRRATAIVDRVRRFLKKRPPERTLEDPARIVRESIDLLAPVFREARVDVRTDLAAADAPVRADPVQIMQILVNLLRNAAEAIQRGPAAARHVHIQTRCANAQFECRIEDSGPPVDGPDFARLFTLFHTTKPGGLGMGLAISRTIAESHGGRLWAERAAHGGLVFRLTLPLEHGDSGNGA